LNPWRTRAWALAALALGGLALAPAVAAAQTRSAACVTANNTVTQFRLGKDRAGRPSRVDLPRAVAAGDAAVRQCRSDDLFLLAYALARIDLSADAKRSTPAQRTRLFNAALADLEQLKTKVLAGKSDRYEVFNILGLIYYDTGQLDRSLAALNAGVPLLPRMTAASRQKTLLTLGMAQARIGQPAKAATTFDLAAKNGHPQAQAIKRQMLGSAK